MSAACNFVWYFLTGSSKEPHEETFLEMHNFMIETFVCAVRWRETCTLSGKTLVEEYIQPICPEHTVLLPRNDLIARICIRGLTYDTFWCWIVVKYISNEGMSLGYAEKMVQFTDLTISWLLELRILCRINLIDSHRQFCSHFQKPRSIEQPQTRLKHSGFIIFRFSQGFGDKCMYLTVSGLLGSFSSVSSFMWVDGLILAMLFKCRSISGYKLV